MPVILDGVISAVSALLAYRLCPKAVYYMLPSHLSPEPSCGLALREMGLRPVIDAGMRLGEGTGAVCLLPLLDTSLAVYKNTITYKDLGF
jgi:nicotinate-nucleotide--dimethylbenzimidazole phosphoribosyltransferase